MSHHTQRLERYYNALLGRGRPGIEPSIHEARRDLRCEVDQQFPYHLP